MKYIIVTCALLFHIVGYADQIKGKPKDIYDGDTFKLSMRMYGFDAPEKNQQCENAEGECYACGIAAHQLFQNTIRNKELVCYLTGEVTYGRPVANCSVDGEDVGEIMLKNGMAVAYKRFLETHPEIKRRYLLAENHAKENKLGIWQGEFIAPNDWRDRNDRLACEQN